MKTKLSDMNVEIKTSDQWYNQMYPNKELTILDPDGWDRQNFQFSYYEEKISLWEFENRVGYSTCIFNKNK